MRQLAAGILAVLALGLLLAGGGYAYVSQAARARLAQTFPDVLGKDIPIPFPLSPQELEALRNERMAALTDEQRAAGVDPLAGVDLDAIARERAIARATALLEGRIPCGECHGMDGAGKLVADARPVWVWYAPNITRGGEHTRNYTAADWDRLVRHGIRPDGTPTTMPAVDFMSLSDQEVSDIVTYYQSLPAVETQQPPIEIGPVGRMLLGLGQVPLSAEDIDHTRTNPVMPPPAGATVEYRAHVASTCVGCHRLDFSGGPIRQGPPDWPAASNLTPGPEGLAGWTLEEFARVFREAKGRDGRDLREPMASVRKMKITDTEIEAMFLFLQSIEPRPTGL